MPQHWYLPKPVNKALLESRLRQAGADLEEKLTQLDIILEEKIPFSEDAGITFDGCVMRIGLERGIFTATLAIQAEIIAMLLNGLGDGEDPTWVYRRMHIEQLDEDY